MTIVLDASVTIARYHHDEVTLPVMQVCDQVDLYGAVAPPFWRVEVANVLQIKVRVGKYDAAERDRLLGDIGSLSIALTPTR